MSTKLLTQISIVMALALSLALSVTTYLLVVEPEPWHPISFEIPALIQYENGEIPTIDGIVGPAVYLGDPGEPVLPITWIERNTELQPVAATYSASSVSFEFGLNVIEREVGAERPLFAPGVVGTTTVAAFSPQFREAVLTLAANGVCASTWQRVGYAEPLRVDDREPIGAEFVSQNFTVVVEGCG